MNESALILDVRALRPARRVVVARDIALNAGPGAVVAVEGGNGSGKSTLLAAAAGLLPAGDAAVRPASVGYAPERQGPLPRMTVSRWLTGLARTAGLSREASARSAADLIGRLGLAPASLAPLRTLSRGNAQRALIAQALIGDPALLVLDEPAGGLDDDGVARVAAEIERAAARRAIVLVSRHPAAPLALRAGESWQIREGAVTVTPRRAESPAAVVPPARPGLVEAETGDGAVRAISAGDQPSRRSGAVPRVLHGAAHRARLLAMSQWFAAPCLIFLAVLGVIYETNAGAPLQAAGVTAIALALAVTWLTTLAHRADGPELARVFAVHAGGRGRAHIASDLSVVPFALVMAAIACVWPLATQGEHRHPASLVAAMFLLHAGGAIAGIGIGSLLVPPLVEPTGWRVILGVVLYLLLFTLRPTPVTPLLRLSTNAGSSTAAAVAAVWLCVLGAVLAAVAAAAASRLLPSS